MPRIAERPAPAQSLIAPFGGRDGFYSDAFSTDLARAVALPGFIRAFYTTPLFRSERLVLRMLGQSATDADLDAVATGRQDRFAAWHVEARREDEILMADVSGRTRSWLHVAATAAGARLWFGSVIVPVDRGGGPGLGPVFTPLIGAHRLYSRALLAAAARRLSRDMTPTG